MEADQNEQDYQQLLLQSEWFHFLKKVFLIWSDETLDTNWHKMHVVSLLTVMKYWVLRNMWGASSFTQLLRVVKFEQDWSDLVFLNLHNHMQIASKVRQMTDYGGSQFAYKESSKWIKINFNEEQINMS